MSPELKAFVLTILIGAIVYTTLRALERHLEARKRHEHQ